MGEGGSHNIKKGLASLTLLVLVSYVPSLRSFTCSENRGVLNLKGSRDQDHANFGLIYDQLASTYYDQFVSQILNIKSGGMTHIMSFWRLLPSVG